MYDICSQVKYWLDNPRKQSKTAAFFFGPELKLNNEDSIKVLNRLYSNTMRLSKPKMDNRIYEYIKELVPEQGLHKNQFRKSAVSLARAVLAELEGLTPAPPETERSRWTKSPSSPPTKPPFPDQAQESAIFIESDAYVPQEEKLVEFGDQDTAIFIESDPYVPQDEKPVDFGDYENEAISIESDPYTPVPMEAIDFKESYDNEAVSIESDPYTLPAVEAVTPTFEQNPEELYTVDDSGSVRVVRESIEGKVEGGYEDDAIYIVSDPYTPPVVKAVDFGDYENEAISIESDPYTAPKVASASFEDSEILKSSFLLNPIRFHKIGNICESDDMLTASKLKLTKD